MAQHTTTAKLKLSGEKIKIGFDGDSNDPCVWYQNQMMPDAHYLSDSDVDLLIAALVNAKAQKKEAHDHQR